MSVRSSGPAGLQLRPVLLGYSISLGTTASFSGLSKAGVYYVPARPCQLIAVSCCCFPYLDHPLCAISCVNHCYIRHAPPPPPPSRAGPTEAKRALHYLLLFINTK